MCVVCIVGVGGQVCVFVKYIVCVFEVEIIVVYVVGNVGDDVLVGVCFVGGWQEGVLV